MRDPLTYRYPRTAMEAFGCDANQAVACQRFKTPLTRRALWFVCDWGWAVVLAAVFLLTGCDDLAVAQAVAQEANEAPALAQMQARAEFIEIAGATYWHGSSNAFAQWTFRDPDEEETPVEWMLIPHGIKGGQHVTE